MTPQQILPRLKFVDYTMTDPGNAGNIYPDRQFAVMRLITAAAETRTLPAPTKSGIVFTINMVTDGGDCTLTVTGGYDESGSTTMVFNDTGDWATFRSVEEGSGTYVWRVLDFDGVTGPTMTLGSVSLAGSLSVGTTSTLTGAVTAGSSVKSTSATAGIGYGTGAGGTVTQATSKTTGVTLSKVVGQITMNNAALAAGAEATFTVTNTAVAATDVVVACHGSAGTSGAYLVGVSNITAGTFDITVSNVSAGSLGEAIVINYAVIKGVSA